MERELKHWNKEISAAIRHVSPTDVETPTTAHLADLHERVRLGEQRLIEIRERVDLLHRNMIDEHEIANVMAAFDPVWDSLTHNEQARVVQLLVERVEYDGSTGKISITFHPTGIKTLADELAANQAEEAA